MVTHNTITAGLSHVIEGARLLTRPGMKRFVLIPLLANILIFVVLTAVLLQYFSTVTEWFTELLSLSSWLWSWLAWIATVIATVLSVLIFFLILLIYGFSFTIITNFIGAPFYGMLAEKVEQTISDVLVPRESVFHMVIRTLGREMVKLWYFFSRGIVVTLGLFLLAFIPLLNLLVPVLALLWAAWVMTLQYADYPADNHQLDFVQLRRLLKQRRWSTIGLGASIMLGSSIPLVNIFVMPIAVAGGTVFWVKELSVNTGNNLSTNSNSSPRLSGKKSTS